MKNKVKYLSFSKIKPLIEEYTNTHKHPDYITEKILIFLTHLYYSQLSKKVYSYTDIKRYSRLNREELRAYLTQDMLSPILDILVANNIIILDRTEKTTYYSKENNKLLFTYRFKIKDFDLYKGYTEKTSVNYTKNETIFKKLYQIKVKGFSGEMLKIVNMQCKMDVNITEDEFYTETLNYYPTYCKKKESKEETVKEFDIYYKEDALPRLELIQKWNKLSLKDRKIQKFVKICKYGNRLHTLFTFIPSYCRKYIDGLGEGIKEIDLHQSQPTIFNKILTDNNIFGKFNDALTNGDIYDTYEPDVNVPRTVKKSKLFSGIFSAHGAPDFLAFEKVYKEEASMMRELQKNTILYYTGTNKKIKQHKNISALLQRKESEIFKAIWIKLINKRIKFISVHDAIYCNTEDYDMVKRTMTFALNKELGKNNWNFNK